MNKYLKYKQKYLELKAGSSVLEETVVVEETLSKLDKLIGKIDKNEFILDLDDFPPLG